MINNIITKAKHTLKEHNIEEFLADYYYNYLQEENIYNEKTYNQGINQLIQGKPIQYIIGNVNFYGNIIKVNKNVLIPRFETELLIEKTINYIKKLYPNQNNLTLADLGTGSGCIAITLKKFFPTIKIDAYELSPKAISVALENAKTNNTPINIIKHDITKPLPAYYDIIISNPPYIANDETIMDIVKNNEPHMALYAKNNGLYFYEQILKNMQPKSKYLIAFEIGMNQGKQIKDIAYKYLDNPTISIEQDYSNKERYIFIYKTE